MAQPIDIQTELGRATLVERVADIQGRLAAAAQQRAHSDAIETRAAAETLVGQTHQAESAEIEPDGRRQAPFLGRRKKRSAKARAASETASTFYTAEEIRDVAVDPEAHKLDISI